MKKLILMLAIMLGTVSFAETSETKEEQKNKLYTLVEKDTTGKTLSTIKFNTKEELLTYCYNSVESWYSYTVTDNIGNEWDVYNTTVVRRCITI
jgi:hypothetical protein